MAKRQRFEMKHQPRFITCSCYGRLQLFNNDAIKDAFVEELINTRRNCDFELHAWVVMPEHIHMLLTPSLPGCTVSKILQYLKSRSASRILRRWYELDAPILKRIRDKQSKAHFWLAGGGYDRNIYAGGEYQEKLHYIHNNPVDRGLVDRPEDWRWSSASTYAKGTFDAPPVVMPLSA